MENVPIELNTSIPEFENATKALKVGEISGIVESTHTYNTDGIINLSSTTLGATGAAGNSTLADVDYKKNTCCSNPDHNHVSPDNMVDVSTAILPENTWIFLDQYHEVGRNDVVLNLAKALLLADAAYRPALKAAGFLTRDPRMKERKKPGLKKARRAS